MGVIIQALMLFLFASLIYMFYIVYRMFINYKGNALNFLLLISFWQFALIKADLNAEGLQYLKKYYRAVQVFSLLWLGVLGVLLARMTGVLEPAHGAATPTRVTPLAAHVAAQTAESTAFSIQTRDARGRPLAGSGHERGLIPTARRFDRSGGTDPDLEPQHPEPLMPVCLDLDPAGLTRMSHHWEAVTTGFGPTGHEARRRAMA